MTESSSSGGVANPEVEAADGDDAFTMENWLQSSADFKNLRRGEVVEGTVMGVQRDGALVDLGAKSEGVVHANEMQSLGADPLSKVSVGDKLLVYVMQPETDQGQILLSVDRARGERGWRVLQTRFEEGEAFEGEVTGFNKGGLLVNVEGVHAFVPLSQVVGVHPDRDDPDGGLGSAVGKMLRLKVIEINRRRNRVILSERAALQEWRTQQKDRLIAELHEGEIRKGRVSSVRSFGVFIDLGGADGLAHLSEVSWDRNKTPEEMYRVGDEVDVYVMKVDAESKKIALSLRRAQPEEWDLIVDKYQVGRVVPGVVTKLVTFGAFARIEGPVEGLVHVSELVDRRIAHPKEVVREGDLLPLKIVRIERDRHRLGLSLRDAREEGIRMGFEFSEAGEVISVPEDLRAEFEEREGPIVRERPVAGARLADTDDAPPESPPEAAMVDAAAEQIEDASAPERPKRAPRAKPEAPRAEQPAPVSAMQAAFERANAAAEETDEAGDSSDVAATGETEVAEDSTDVAAADTPRESDITEEAPSAQLADEQPADVVVEEAETSAAPAPEMNIPATEDVDQAEDSKAEGA